MNEELKKLYDAIASRGFYTKSYDEFVNQYQDPAYRDKVFAVVTREGLYTKGRNEFDAKYSAAPLKKKEPSVSTSQEGAMAPATEAGLLASQESAPVLDFTKLRQEQQAQQFGELPAQPQAEPAMPPSPQLQQQVMGRMASPKSKTVETTRADGTPVTVQFGPTQFKSSDEAPVPQFKTFSEMAGQVDATIDEPTKQKISQSIGITGAVFNKIVSPNASVPEAINQAKAFADNTQAAYNVGVLSGQISNNMQQSVPDKERIAKLNKELKQEQTKLLSSQMGADASNFFDMLASNPVTFLTEVLTTSAAQMTAGVGGMRPEDLAAAGLLTLTTGTGGAAYMAGRNSLNAEMSSRIMGALEERGVDITDAAQLETAMTNRDLMMEIAGEVQAPATFIAALDALSAGMAGKLGKPIYEVLAQSLTGSIGEAGAQFIESGEITSASAVLTEAVAELPGGLVETAFGAKTKDVQRKIEINRQLKDVEAQIDRTEDEDTKSVLRSVADNLRNEKNKIYDDYAAFVNSLPEEDVARLNSLNEEIVKTSKAIDQVDNAATKDALKARRSALLKQVEQLENKQQDAVQEQATDEAAVVPDEIQSLKDDEIVTFTVESLDQVPDEFRDRAEKKDGTEIEIRKTILGLPIGEKTTKVVNSGYTYTLTGKEAKDYAIQKQATDESVLRAEQPEVGLQEVGERDQEPQVAAEEEVGTVGTLLNERVVYDDPVSGQPVEGDLFVEGQRVVLEAAGGQQFDLGNVDDVLAQPLDGGIVRPAEMAIMPQEDGSFVFNKDGNQKVAKGTQMFNNQPGLQAITRDDAGNVKRVTLYSEDGTETYNLTGQEAEDAAYYIVRGFVETQEGQDAINQLAERNEEARRDLTKPIGVPTVQQVAPQAAAQVRAEAPTGPVVEGAEADVDAQELADLAADMQAATPARRERLERIAERARTAVSKILPDVKIIVHDTQEAYRAATTFEGEATYNNDTKTIHINSTKATPAAVAHEVFHAVFLDKVKTDAKAQAVAKKMVESLKRVLGENSEAYQYLDEFSKDYDANLQNEEKLAEMVAVLSELYSGVNDIGLSPSAVQSVKSAIKKFITDLAKLFNIPMATTLTDADVLAVLNTIAQKAVTGEVITEADVRTIDRVAAEDITPVAQSEVQMRERKGLITITEREAQKYARIGINDARVAQAMEDLGLAGVKFTKGDVEAAISKAFDKAIDELKADMYNGQPAVITQDSPGITNAIQAEITALEEQGASLSRIESAKQMVNDPRTRNEYIRKYQDTQKETLAQWVSYLEQSDYDPAFKMLMLDAVVTSNYDYKLEKYFKRNSTTIRNMAPFDAGTLAELYGMTENKELLKTYAEIQADNASRVVKANMMKSTKEGKWLKFAGGDNVSEAERETNANALSQLVQNTFWCTKTNAKSQLDGGDFYVYVTEGTDMRPIPRIAVRMDGSDVGELRGNASSKQDLEPEMLPVAEKFLKEEIPGGSGQKWLDSIAFNKKAKAFAESIDGSTLSMNMINEFAKLASESAKYNVDYGGNGFIERIEESIKAKVEAGDVTPELDGVIETSLGDANPRTKIFIGNMRGGVYDRLQNVEIVIGNVRIVTTEIVPPSLRVITGDLDLGSDIKSLSNIETVGGEIYFGNSFSTLEDLGKIEVINGGYLFSPPTKIKKFDYLKTINGNLDISPTSFIESLGSLEVINGSLEAINSDLNSLGNLKSVSENVELPEGVKKIDGVSFGGRLELFDGTEIINVKTIPGNFIVNRVSGMKSKHSATGSIEEIGGLASLYNSSSTMLGNLKRVGKGVGLPDNITSLGNLSHVNGDISVFGDEIKSLDNLEYVGGDLTIGTGISSIGNLRYVGGDIKFSPFSRQQIETLDKLEYVGGLIEGAKNIKDIGALSSVGERWISGFKNNTGEDVNIAAFAARYVADSRIDGGPIAEKVYELALKQASKYFGVELPPAPRQRKDSDAAYENWKNGPKSVAQEIGYKYNMNYKGYTPSNIVKQHFKNDVERLSSRLSIRSTITGSGYYMTLDGKFFNPYLKVIGGQDSGPNGLRQRMGQPNENIFDIVTMARQKGYTDKTIEIYLKQEGFAAQDIKDAMAVNSNIDGAQVPQEFGNVTGGMAQGQTLFDEIKAKLTKMAADGASMMDIRIEAQTLLMDSEVYKAQSVEVKAQLRLSLDATIGTKAADRAFRQEFKQLRAMLADRKKARRELETIKRMMRGFIRKNLPQGEYSKAEVVALLKSIVDANVDTLPLVMEKVEGYVTGFKVRKLESQIKKLLATKTTKVDSGRAMGITTIDVQEDLAALDEMLIDDGMSEQNKEDLLLKHLNEYQTLSSKYDLTDKDIRDLQLLKIAIAYNEAMMLDNDNPVKVESLTLARDRMTVMITVGRSEFKAAQAAKHQAQKKNVVDLIEAITGEPVPFDIESKESIDEYVRNQKVSEANASILKSRISKVLGAFAKNPLKAYFDRSASLSGLLGQITANLTDMFGGPVSEMVYGKIKQSDIEFERGMQARSKILDSKLREIYGKDYPIYVKRNKIAGLIDIFKKERAAEARKLMEEMKTASFKRKNEIMLELSDMRVFTPLSQNQIYYLYNQFKDESNRAGLEANYGKDYVEQLNELFEKYLDPKVREWADWQANLLFPELYDVYNPVYVEIFNTNMPWTANYAGRVYREGADETEMAITIMNNKGEYSNIQTPSSTKSRKNNNRKIAEMDGDLVLDSYISDMEYFRAYGATIRDVDRMFKNEAVKASIKKVAGEDVLKLIQDYIKIVGTNGMSVGTPMKQSLLDSVDSRLGISYMAGALNQLIKQLTSAFLFAPRIGINNWLMYTAKAAPQLGGVWNEFIDNAPRIVKRYNPKEMAKILGGYDSKRSKQLAKNGGVTDNMRVLKVVDTTGQALDALMWPVTQGDKHSAMVGAMGNYLYYKDMYMQKNPNATQDEVIKFAADKVSTEIEQVLGSSSRIDKDSFQNSGNALFRALSFLSNSPKAMIRNIIPAYTGLFKKIASFDKTAGPGTLKQNLETVLMVQVFVPVLFKWAAIALPGLWREWRDEDDEELGAAAILGPFEALLIVGPLLTFIKDQVLDKPWADDVPTIPIYDLVEDLARQVNKIVNAETDEDLEDGLLNISYIIAGGFGIPAKNIDRMIRNIGEVLDGNEDPGEALLRLFNYSDYAIEGPKEK
jgi:hypothetical protein